MAKTRFQVFTGNVRKVINTYIKQGIDIFYSATFITGKEKIKLMDHAPESLFHLVSQNVKVEKPDKIKIELFDSKEATHSLWLRDFVFKEPEPERVQTGFMGLGEVEINRLVDERFRERKQQVEFEELKEQVIELTEENEALQETVDRLEEINETLQQELESKKQIRYYAGMLGDIFESFGIAKDRIKKPIAELMGINDPDNTPKALENAEPDNSGIVEEPIKAANLTAEEKKRQEIISLIAEYLNASSNQTLAEVFSIFSEIEADTSMAAKILEHIQTLKK